MDLKEQLINDYYSCCISFENFYNKYDEANNELNNNSIANYTNLLYTLRLLHKEFKKSKLEQLFAKKHISKNRCYEEMRKLISNTALIRDIKVKNNGIGKPFLKEYRSLQQKILFYLHQLKFTNYDLLAVKHEIYGNLSIKEALYVIMHLHYDVINSYKSKKEDFFGTANSK